MKKDLGYLVAILVLLVGIFFASCNFDEDVNISGNLYTSGYMSSPDIYADNYYNTSGASANSMRILSQTDWGYNQEAIRISTLNTAGTTYNSRMKFGGHWDRSYVSIANADFTLSGYMEFRNQYQLHPPNSPVLNGSAFVYSVDGTDNLTDLCAIFNDGSIDIFAQESTELDSPIFRYSSNTELKLIIRKPTPAIIQFVAVFPDSTEYVLKELQYHSTEKINANIGAENKLPDDWFQETETEKEYRILHEYDVEDVQK